MRKSVYFEQTSSEVFASDKAHYGFQIQWSSTDGERGFRSAPKSKHESGQTENFQTTLT